MSRCDNCRYEPACDGLHPCQNFGQFESEEDYEDTEYDSEMETGEVVEKVVPPHTVYNKNTMEVVDCIGVEYVPSKIEVKD